MVANLEAVVVQEVEEVVENNRGFLGRLANKISNWFGKVEERADRLDARADQVKTNVRETVANAQERLNEAQYNFYDKGTQVFGSFNEAGERAVNGVVQGAKNAVNAADKAATAYGEAVDGLVVKAEQGINQAGVTLQNAGNQVINVGVKVADAAIVGLTDGAEKLADGAINAIGQAAKSVSKLPEKAAVVGQQIEDKYREVRWNVLEAGERGINAINELPENTLNLVKNIGKVIDNGAERYGNAVDAAVQKTEQGLNQAGKTIKNAANKGLDAGVAAVDATFNAIDTAGEKMVDGIINVASATQRTAQNVGSKIKQSFSWAADKLREGKTILQEKLADPYKPDMYKPCKLDVLTEINPDKNYSGKEVRNQLINEMTRLGQDNPQLAQYASVHANKMFNQMAKDMDKQAGKIDGKYASHQLTMTGQQIQELAGQMMEGAEKDLTVFAERQQAAKGTGISTFKLRNAAPETAKAFAGEMKSHVSGALINEAPSAIDKVNGALDKNATAHAGRQATMGAAIGEIKEAHDIGVAQGGKAPVVKGKGL